MADKKNLVEEALLQMENLQEAITNNAKGILASTMKEEISELVKESLEEEEVEMSEAETEENVEMSEQEDVDMEVDVEDEEGDMEDALEDLGLDMGGDMESDNDEELEMGDEEMLMTDLPGDDLEVDDEEEVLLPLDLTAASDDEILKVFKAMGEDDGIIVKQDGDDVHLADTETDAEYVIQLGESEETDEAMGDHLGEEDHMEEGEYKEEDHMEGEYKEEDHMEEEVVYEIEIGEEEEAYEEMGEGQGYDDREDERESAKHGKIADKDLDSEKARRDDAGFEEANEGETEEGETKESSVRSYANGRHTNLKPDGFPKGLMRPAMRENKELKAEVQQLREKNEEYRKALNVFKTKLNEVAVFNSNLAYATRLFTEHSTTKQEKINILRRFDGVETLKESKSLYKTIKEDLGGKETDVVTESVQSKVTKTPTKGSANNLIESKTYENPQFLRMRDLMSKLK